MSEWWMGKRTLFERWVVGLPNYRLVGLMDERTDGCIVGGRMDVWIDWRVFGGRTDCGWMDELLDGWIGRWFVGWITEL